ncbi:MAG: dihydrofolate reductase [Dehalococcoidia bacterium]|nr:dihydrofolate reductase [Dehalococcoidia bacterium]
MGVVAVDKSISLDGFITGPDPSPESPLGAGGERLFSWMMAAAPDGYSSSEMNKAWDQLFGDAIAGGTGAVIMGRKSFDIIDSPEGWVAPDGTAFDWPVFVLTHRPLKNETKGATPFTFVSDGVESALGQARATAGEKNIGLHGASVAQQFLKAGLLDEIHLHVVPVLLGDGVPLFDQRGDKQIELERTRMIETPGATHLSFSVIKSG